MRSNTLISQSNAAYATLQLALMVAYAADKLTIDQQQVLRRWIMDRTEADERRQRMVGMLGAFPRDGQRWNAAQFEKRASALSAFLNCPESRQRAFALAFDICKANPSGEVLTGQALLKLPSILKLPNEFVLEIVMEKGSQPADAIEPAVEKPNPLATLGCEDEGERDTVTGGELTLMSVRS